MQFENAKEVVKRLQEEKGPKVTSMKEIDKNNTSQKKDESKAGAVAAPASIEQKEEDKKLTDEIIEMI